MRLDLDRNIVQMIADHLNNGHLCSDQTALATIGANLQGLLDRDPAPSFSSARYARNMIAVTAPGVGGYKSRAGRLCEHLKARYSNRENAYIMSFAKSEKLRRLFARGADANSLTGTLREVDE